MASRQGDNKKGQYQQSRNSSQEQKPSSVPNQDDANLTPLYRYWKASKTDHFYTTNANEIGTSASGQTGRYDYECEGTQCLLYAKQVRDTVPLYRYWNSSSSDHFYTTSSEEIGTTTPGTFGRYGYLSEGVAGYCFPHAAEGTVPLYRYYDPSGSDHFYTTSSAEIGVVEVGKTGKHGYRFEGVTGYVVAYNG